MDPSDIAYNGYIFNYFKGGAASWSPMPSSIPFPCQTKRRV